MLTSSTLDVPAGLRLRASARRRLAHTGARRGGGRAARCCSRLGWAVGRRQRRRGTVAGTGRARARPCAICPAARRVRARSSVALTAPAGAGRSTCGPIRWLGTVSYGTYLWHMPVRLLAASRAGCFPGDPLGAFLSIAIPAFTLGALSWYAVERHVVRLARSPRRRAAQSFPGEAVTEAAR